MSSAVLTQDALVLLVQDAYVQRYSAVAGLALLVYEYCLSFPDEKDHIWLSRWTFFKVGFFVNRYLPLLSFVGYVSTMLFAIPATSVCGTLQTTFTILAYLAFYLSASVLVVRAHVIWSRTCTIYAVLATVYSLTFGISFYFSYRYFQSFDVETRLLPEICFMNVNARLILPSFILSLASSIIALIAFMTQKSEMSRTHLTRFIINDGIIAYVAIAMISLVNVILLAVARPSISTILLPTQANLHSIICTRLLLRLRSSHAVRGEQPSTASRISEKITLETIQFYQSDSDMDSPSAESIC